MTTIVFNSKVFGNTEDYHGTVYVYGNTDDSANIDNHCDAFLRSYDFNSSDDMINDAPSSGALIEV